MPDSWGNFINNSIPTPITIKKFPTPFLVGDPERLCRWQAYGAFNQNWVFNPETHQVVIG
jgi:hypothetical protein